MIYTCTLNPALDVVVTATAFEKGRINAYTDEKIFPGGKGINVSIMLSNLGIKTTALGICAGFTGDEIVRLLGEKGILSDFLSMKSGNSRINIKVRAALEETEVNGKGPVADKNVLSALLGKLEKTQKSDTVILAGSLPPGAPADFYGEALRRISGRAVVDALDLRPLLHYRPFLVKPNHHELGDIFGVTVGTPEAAEKYGTLLRREGAQNVLVSMGEAGAVLLCEQGSRFMPAVHGETVSPCGAGDSMVAGFLYGYSQAQSFEDAMKWATAAGAATAFSAGIANGEKVRDVYAKTNNC